MSISEQCLKHPSVLLEWDGYGLICPSCVLGYPSEIAENFENLLEFYQRELAAAYARATIFEPEWTGFTGILGIADEWKGQPVSVWHWSERPKIFTPAEFNKLWDSFSELRKVEYVLSLIT